MLAVPRLRDKLPSMIPAEISEAVLQMPEQDRIELARVIVASVFPVAEETAESEMEEGLRRLDDIVAGRVKPLSEEEFRKALG